MNVLEASLVGESQAHRILLQNIGRVAPTDAEVLITGPTGVGKELYARLVHRLSRRVDGPFVAVNCGALPVDLFENELFGHVGGAFTGARPRSEGLVVLADRGTLFLDEVDCLALPCQVKLLRLIQEKEYRRLGESRTRHANIRIVAAANSDLQAAVREHQFRKDLFFRLRVIPVDVPALSERSEDIYPILMVYVTKYSQMYEAPRVSFSAEAMTRVLTYKWPGNVRELENCVRYLTCLKLARPVEPEDLPLLEEEPHNGAGAPASMNRTFREAKKAFERNYLDCMLRKTHGNIKAAADLSGMDRRAFFELMRKHALERLSYVDQTAAAWLRSAQDAGDE